MHAMNVAGSGGAWQSNLTRPYASVQKIALLDGDHDALRIRAAAGVDVDWDASFAATIWAEASQRRLARLLSLRSGLPYAIWQSDQYSPVIPVT